MADAFDQFQDAPDDPWAGFRDAPAPRKSQMLGFEKGIMTPLDNAAMALEGGLKRMGVPTDAMNRMLGAPSAAQAADNHAGYVQQQAAQGVVPGKIGEFAGNMAGTLPLAMATKNPIALGAMSGAALTEKRDPTGVLMDMLVGAAAGHAGDKVAKVAAGILKPLVRKPAAIMKQAGVTLTPGQQAGGKAMVREDKLMSRPFVGDAIRADRQAGLDSFVMGSLDKALAPLGLTVPKSLQPGHDAVAFAQDAVNAAYNQVVPNLKLTVQRSDLVKGANVPASQSKEFRRILNDNLGNGQLTGRALKNAEGEIKRLAGSYSRSQVAAERELGFALGRVHDRLTAAMIAQNPADAAALKAANKAFRGVATVEDAASRADSGLFSTGQLKQAVRRADGTRRKGASARGGAYMQDFSNAARETLPAKYPDSGTAGRLQGGIIAGARGAADLVGYRARQGAQRLADIPRPAAVQRAGEKVLQHRNLFALPGPAAGAALRDSPSRSVAPPKVSSADKPAQAPRALNDQDVRHDDGGDPQRAPRLKRHAEPSPARKRKKKPGDSQAAAATAANGH